MALNPLNSSNLEQLALKGLNHNRETTTTCAIQCSRANISQHHRRTARQWTIAVGLLYSTAQTFQHELIALCCITKITTSSASDNAYRPPAVSVVEPSCRSNAQIRVIPEFHRHIYRTAEWNEAIMALSNSRHIQRWPHAIEPNVKQRLVRSLTVQPVPMLRQQYSRSTFVHHSSEPYLYTVYVRLACFRLIIRQLVIRQRHILRSYEITFLEITTANRNRLRQSFTGRRRLTSHAPLQIFVALR